MEQVDKGAIKFVLSGANIMCPGLTSPGAVLTPVDKGTTVVSFFIFVDFNCKQREVLWSIIAETGEFRFRF